MKLVDVIPFLSVVGVILILLALLRKSRQLRKREASLDLQQNNLDVLKAELDAREKEICAHLAVIQAGPVDAPGLMVMTRTRNGHIVGAIYGKN